MSLESELAAMTPEQLIATARNYTNGPGILPHLIEQLADLAESTGAELSRRIADDVQRSEAENDPTAWEWGVRWSDMGEEVFIRPRETLEWAIVNTKRVAPEVTGALLRRRPAGPWEPVS